VSIIIIYALVCLIRNAFYIPSKRGMIVFRDESAWLTFIVFFIAAINILSNVVDYYDKRDNAEFYRKFRKITFWLGWIMLVLSLLLDLFVFNKGQTLK
jgi:uncharacterized membrane protein YecN with MAPEG domain